MKKTIFTASKYPKTTPRVLKTYMSCGKIGFEGCNYPSYSGGNHFENFN